MGFFVGFLIGIPAGIIFGQNDFSYPLGYVPRPNGFGKATLNL